MEAHQYPAKFADSAVGGSKTIFRWREVLEMLPVVYKLLWPLVATLTFIWLSQMAYASSVAYLRSKPLGVPVHLVVVDLCDPGVAVTVGLAGNRLGTAEPFTRMVHRLSPAAAVTGTYFCTRTKLPVGDIVTSGNHVYSGSVRTALTLTGNNKAAFCNRSSIRDRWKEFETVLCAGPRLLEDGKIKLSPRQEGFRDPRVFAARPRTAMGLTRHGKLLLMVTRAPLSLSRLANVMQALGAWDAMALDGGSSTAMYYRGKVVVSPARWLTNVVAVYTNYPLAKRKLPATKRVAKAQPAVPLQGERLKQGAEFPSASMGVLMHEESALLVKSGKENIPL